MSSQELNLIPPSVLLRAELRRRIRLWGMGATLFLLLFPLGRLGLEVHLARAEKILAGQRRQVEARELALLSVKDLERERDRLGRELMARSALIPAGSLLGILRALDESLPGQVYLTSLSARPAGSTEQGETLRGREPPHERIEVAEDAGFPDGFTVRIEGIAPTNDLLAAFLFRLATRRDMSQTELEFSRREVSVPSPGVRFAVNTQFQPREMANSSREAKTL